MNRTLLMLYTLFILTAMFRPVGGPQFRPFGPDERARAPQPQPGIPQHQGVSPVMMAYSRRAIPWAPEFEDRYPPRSWLVDTIM